MLDFVKNWDKRKVTGVVAVVAVAVGLWGWLSNQPLAGDDCHVALRHVYEPSRLGVIATCQQIVFRVAAWGREHDDDVHVNGTVVGDQSWVNAQNVTGQHGLTVVEFVPGDPRPKTFYANQLLRLTVTKVYDEGHRRPSQPHGWIEGHPVFAAKDVTPRGVTPGPDRPALAPRTER